MNDEGEMDPGPEIEPHHRHHTGKQWVDVALGVSVILISIISLMLAMENGAAMKRLVESNSWPFVLLTTSNGDENGNKLLRLLVQNKGVGPAKIETLEVFYKGQSMPDARTLVHAILGPGAQARHIPFTVTTVVGNVLSSKESDDFLSVNDKSLSASDLKTFSDAADNVESRTCYCSVFDECWVFDTRATTIHPQSVKICPVPATPFKS